VVILAIVVNLDVMLAKRKMRLQDLSKEVGISIQNLSILKTGKAKAIRFSTLEIICKQLKCQPGDLLVWQEADEDMPCCVEAIDKNQCIMSD
jgi:putative transcriptional regulator